MKSGTLLLLVLFLCPIHAETLMGGRSCPVIATLPASLLDWTEPLEQRQRFELRQCGGDQVIVAAYEKGKAVPSLVVDTGDGYPVYLTHTLNVLVFQSPGGSADHVYVFAFHDGKPSLALKTATKDQVEVRQSVKAAMSVMVIVRPSTLPGPDGNFASPLPPKQYSFPLEY
jgi:hypothetical protein